MKQWIVMLTAVVLGAGSVQAELTANIYMPVLSLSDRIKVESRLPAYVNTDAAIMVFDRSSAAEGITVELSFLEKDRSTTPATPVTVVLAGTSLRSEQQIDISSWSDGEYKVFISEPGSPEAPLVRGIRKQTIVAPLPPTGSISMEGSKMFFVDDWYFEKTKGLKRQVNPADLIPIEAWKLDPAYFRVRNDIRSFWFDQAGDLNVYIKGWTDSDTIYYWVKSSDLKTWSIVSGPSAKSDDCSIVKLGNPAIPLPAGTSYRRYDPATDGPVVLSEVQIQWSAVATTWGDVSIPARSRSALWVKPGDDVLILGDPITIGKHTFAYDDIGAWSDSNDNFGDIRYSADGTTISFQQTRLIPKYDPFWVHFDNNVADRIMVNWSSTNGVDWIPSFFCAPTLEDPWSTQNYGEDIWDEENNRLQFSYHKIFDCQLEKLYTEVVYSRDGSLWNRLEDTKPFLENGPRGTFNYGYSITTGERTNDGWYRMTWGDDCYEPVRWSMNVLHFMFLATTASPLDDITPEFYAQHMGGRMMGEYGVENSPIMDDYTAWDDICETTKSLVFTPVFMRYRTDGWISALPKQRRAEITTKPLLADGTLAINAKAEPDGFIMVEVLDPYGNELEAYSKSNAAFFKGDNVDGALVWSGGLVTELPGGSFKLRITLEKAEVFTMGF